MICAVLGPNHCPSAAAFAFEDHYISCARCAAVLEETKEYVLAMKRTTARLRPGKARSV